MQAWECGTHGNICHFERSEKSRSFIPTRSIPLSARDDNVPKTGRAERRETEEGTEATDEIATSRKTLLAMTNYYRGWIPSKYVRE